MKITVVGKNMQVRDSLKELVENKLSKFRKFFESNVDARATLSHLKELQTVEITIFLKNGVILRAEDSADEMENAVDSAIDKLLRQLRKHKTNMEKQYRKNTSIRYEEVVDFSDFVEEESDEPKIVRTKKFPVKPMSPEEAVLQMEMLNHAFFVFLNDKTEEVNVVYKRKGEDYGLIEPQI